jgi:predicted Na+-dependent transporter
MKIFNLLERHASLFIIISMVVGLTIPFLGDVLKNYVLWALVGIMFSTFLKIDQSEITKEFKKPLFLIYILVLYVLIIPVLLFFIMKIITPELCLGFLLFASLPPALASPALTGLIKGNSALSLTIVTLINLIIPFSMVGLFSILTTADLELDILGMFQTLSLVVFVPLLITQIFKKLAPQAIEKIKPSLSGFSVLFIMFIVYALVASQAEQILTEPFRLIEYVGYLYGIFFTIFLVGYFVAPWRSHKDRLALAITKAYPNTGLGAVLAFKFFTPEITLLLVIAQIPWSTTLGAFKWLGNKLK